MIIHFIKIARTLKTSIYTFDVMSSQDLPGEIEHRVSTLIREVQQKACPKNFFSSQAVCKRTLGSLKSQKNLSVEIRVGLFYYLPPMFRVWKENHSLNTQVFSSTLWNKDADYYSFFVKHFSHFKSIQFLTMLEFCLTWSSWGSWW